MTAGVRRDAGAWASGPCRPRPSPPSRRPLPLPSSSPAFRPGSFPSCLSLLASFCLSDHTRPSTQVPRHLKHSSNMQANKMQQERHVPGAAFASPGRGSVSLGPPRRRSGCPAAHVAVRRFRLAPRRGSASSTVQLGPALTERSPASAASSRPMELKRPAGPAGPPRPGTAGLVTRQQRQLIGTGGGGRGAS